MKNNISYTLLRHLLFVLLLGFSGAFAQTARTAWLLFPSEQDIISMRDGRTTLKNTEYNDFLEKADIKTIRRSFPYSKNDTLRRLYTVSIVEEKIPILFSEKRIERAYIQEDCEDIVLYDPSDAFWPLTTDSTYLWHLKKIQANLAWNITKGSPDVKIAIIDTWFDINHPDLINQMYVTYDPLDNQPFYSSASHNNHGTTVASLAAAETDGGGDLASVGFNSKIIPYKAHGVGIIGYLERAQHASLAMNADVLTSSAGGWSCSNNFNDIERIAVREILDNGTVIVMPAGNGWRGVNCTINGEYAPWRPLHPHYDDRIIIVSSTDKNDNHTFYCRSFEEMRTHSHFPYVDICAPGVETWVALVSVKLDGTPAEYLYYPYSTGTSNATPIVAGVAALLKSINRDLTPAEIKNIIKSTADPIADAHLFPGLLGAGRVNAYKAVKAACATLPPTFNFTNQTVTTSRTITSCGDINVQNVTVTSGAILTLKAASNINVQGVAVNNNSKLILDAGEEVNIINNFEVALGSELEIK